MSLDFSALLEHILQCAVKYLPQFYLKDIYLQVLFFVGNVSFEVFLCVGRD